MSEGKLNKIQQCPSATIQFGTNMESHSEEKRQQYLHSPSQTIDQKDKKVHSGDEPVKKDKLRLSFFHWCVDTTQRADTNQCAYTKLRPYTHARSTNYALS